MNPPAIYIYISVYRVAEGLEAFEAESSEGVFHLIKFMCCKDISQIHERPRSSPALKRLKIDEFYRVQQHLQRPQCIPFRGTERSPRLAPLHSGSGMAVQVLLNSLDSIYSIRGKRYHGPESSTCQSRRKWYMGM